MERVCGAVEARANFSELVTEAGFTGRHTTIQRNNRPVAVILGYQEYLALRRQAAERAARFEVYDEIRGRNREAEPEQVAADVAEALRMHRCPSIRDHYGIAETRRKEVGDEHTHHRVS